MSLVENVHTLLPLQPSRQPLSVGVATILRVVSTNKNLLGDLSVISHARKVVWAYIENEYTEISIGASIYMVICTRYFKF